MRKSKLVIIITVLVAVSIASALGNPSTFNFYPTDDSYVDAYNPSKNYGSSTYLIVGRESGTKRAYLKFNISVLDCDGIEQAKLKIYSVSASNEYVGAYKTSEFYKDSTEPWKELGINWNNAPTDFELLDYLLINSTGFKSFDVTKAVSEAFEENKIVSIALRFLNESGSSATQKFYSKDTTCHNWDPYLEISCAYYECKSDQDCKPNYCSQAYQDYCEGRKLFDYNKNKILDNTTVENYCNNTCQENHTCTNCTPDCSLQPSSYCVKGVCGAECDEENKCEPKIEDNYCYFNDQCDLDSCTCNYSNQEFCPEPGSVYEGYCYWGERSCSESGCSLNKTLMQGNNYCDPLNGPKDTEPPVPPILYASVNGNSITLTWQNASDNVGIDHFTLYRAIDSNFVDISGNLSPSQTTFVDSGLEYSTTYYYMVGVFDFSGNSANSTVVSATTGLPQPKYYIYVPPCQPNWSCSNWNDCTPEGIQTRSCTDLNNCGTNLGKPNETQSCVYSLPIKPVEAKCEENWNCSDWSDCINGTRKRVCIDLNNCNTTLNKPIEVEECEEEIKPEEKAPFDITGMFLSFFLNPVYSLFFFLIILAIISMLATYRLERKR